MQEEIFNGQIRELKNNINTAYILNDSDIFYDIGFRVMKNQAKKSLVPCHRLKYNGKMKLVYFTEEYTPLSQKIEEADIDTIGFIIANLTNAISEVENNGFLNISSIDNRLEKIFVENTSLTIKMIYLPINVAGIGKNKSTFENEIRSQLVRMIQERLQNNPQLQHILLALTDETICLSDMVNKYHILSGGERRISSNVIRSDNSNSTINNGNGELKLEAVNGKFIMHISKNEYLIGKSREKVDGVIANNNAISRIHCKILYQDNKYYISDMGSANGTFVNSKRIKPEELVEIRDGFKVKLANMEFTAWR